MRLIEGSGQSEERKKKSFNFKERVVLKTKDFSDIVNVEPR